MKTQELQPESTASSQLGARRGQRFDIRSHMTRIVLTLPAEEDQDPSQLNGRVQNLSFGGAKLSLDGMIGSGQEVDLKLTIPHMEFELNCRAVVRWQTPRDAATWWTGVEVEPKFTLDFIHELAAADVLDRRLDQRYNVSKPVLIRGELGDSDLEATIVNFSKGGFCVKFEDPDVDISQKRFMVKLPDDQAQIPARVMWHRYESDACFVGCSFFSPDGFMLLRAYAEPKKLARKRQLRKQRWILRPMSKWMAITLLVLASIQTIGVVQDNPRVFLSLWQSAGEVWMKYVDHPIRSQLERLDER